MARITGFFKLKRERVGRHTDVECGYAIVDHDGQPALLLETYGSSGRAMPGRMSQSFLLEASTAKELRRLIKKSF